MADVRIVSTTPCDCCGGGAAECRSRGGSASMCGINGYGDPFISPANPLNFYKTKSVSGSFVGCTDCGSCVGASPGGNTVVEWSGSLILGPVVSPFGTLCGEISNTLLRKTGTAEREDGCPTPPLLETNYGEPDCGDTDVTCTETTKQFNRSFSAPTNCQGGAPNCGTVSENADFSATLSDLDTEADAISRLLAGATWSSWGTGAPCLAQWQNRSNDNPAGFAYSEAEWRVARTGLVPLTAYQVSVPILRRVFETGSYTLFQTVVGTVTTDGTGAFSVTGTVPNAQGYQTYAGSPTVTKV